MWIGRSDCCFVSNRVFRFSRRQFVPQNSRCASFKCVLGCCGVGWTLRLNSAHPVCTSICAASRDHSIWSCTSQNCCGHRNLTSLTCCYTFRFLRWQRTYYVLFFLRSVLNWAYSHFGQCPQPVCLIDILKNRVCVIVDDFLRVCIRT